MEQFYWWGATVVLLETWRNCLHCMGRFSSHAIGVFSFGRFLLSARDDPSLCTWLAWHQRGIFLGAQEDSKEHLETILPVHVYGVFLIPDSVNVLLDGGI